MSSLTGNVNTKIADGSTGVTSFNLGTGALGTLATSTDLRLVACVSILTKGNTKSNLTSITDSEGLTWHKAASTDMDGINQPGGLTGAPLTLSCAVWYTDTFQSTDLSSPSTYTITAAVVDQDIDSMYFNYCTHKDIDPSNALDPNVSFPASDSQMSGSSAVVSASGLSTDTANIQVVCVFGSVGPGQRPNNSGDANMGGDTSSDYGQSDTFHLNQNFHIHSSFTYDKTAQLSSVTIQSRDATNNALMLAVVFTQDSTGTNGNATGVLLDDVQFSLISGTASEATDGDADGDTITATASILSGLAGDNTEIDGKFIYEITFQTIAASQFANADYYSIYSIGDRNKNGLITANSFGVSGDYTIAAGSFDNNYAHALGSGWTPHEANPQNTGGMRMVFAEPVQIAAVKPTGSNQYDDKVDAFQLFAGFDQDNVVTESYAREFDAFIPMQDVLNATHGMYEHEYITTPRVAAQWAYYEFRFFPNPIQTHGENFAEDLEIKINHSELDGGDRRSTNGNPNKRTVFSMSSGWKFTNSDPIIDPANAWFDGSILRNNSTNGTTGQKYAIVSKAGGGTNPQDVPGEYFEFRFPRKVTPKHILFQVTDKEVWDSGDEPTIYGKWHWEYSNNNGVSYTPIGDVWWFKEDCFYMLGPHTGDDFGMLTDLPDGADRWRMVLDEGNAFGNHIVYECLFNLEDRGGLQQALEANLSDDADGLLPALTVTAGSPYTVNLTDGTDDKLTGTLTIIPNPLLSAHLTDDNSLNFRASFEPLAYVQSCVMITGR